MADDEFSFIHRFFSNLNPEFEAEARKMGLVLGIGDDAALLNLDGNYAITTDTMLENVHFFPNFNPTILGARTLEVNFSDLYAMGAQPQFVTLSINIPDRYLDYDTYWSSFSEGFAECLQRHHSTLIGGNICRTNARSAPLSLTVTAIGKNFKKDRCLRRDKAKIGDVIVCTGTLACNALFVKSTYNSVIRGLDSEYRRDLEKEAFLYDQRMSKFVEMLLPWCECAIDVSDGLLGDLSHILVQSKCAALLNYESLPISEFAKELSSMCRVTNKSLMRMALAGGGDYNLLCTMSPENYEHLLSELKACPEMHGFKVTKIGEIIEPTLDQMDELENNYLATSPGLVTLINDEGKPANLKLGAGSFNHFLSTSGV